MCVHFYGELKRNEGNKHLVMERNMDMFVGALTHSGVVRERNEDTFCIVRDAQGEAVAFIVADGMGGHSLGDVASKIATECVEMEILKALNENQLNKENMPMFFQMLFSQANEHVLRVANEHPNHSGMGTTLTVLLFFQGDAYIAHVGDSRAYLFREDVLSQITVDHSYVQELVDNGTITPEQAVVHPSKNVITRAIGGHASVEIDLETRKLQQNDAFLLCTDGLTNMLTDIEIANCIAANTDAQTICEELLEGALTNGGYDNITVVFVRSSS